MLQAAQGFQEDLAAPYRQVAALHQADGEFSGQHHMFEPERVAMAWRQQRHPGTVTGGQGLQHVAADIHERAQLHDLLGLEQLRDDPRQNAAVFQRIRQPRGLVRPFGQHPPAAIRAAQQIGGVEMQEPILLAAIIRAAGAQIGRIVVNQGWRQHAFGQQVARAVQIAQNRFQQGRPLPQSGFERGKLRRGNRQWDRIAAPVDRLLSGQHRGDAFLREGLFQHPRPRCQGVATETENRAEQSAPMGADLAGAIRHFVQWRAVAHAVTIGWITARSARHSAGLADRPVPDGRRSSRWRRGGSNTPRSSPSLPG